MTKPTHTHICQIKPVKPNLSSQIYQTKPSKPSLPNHTYGTNSTKPTRPSLPNQNFQRNKSKAPKLNLWAKLANPNVNQIQTSLSLPWAWHSSAPACFQILTFKIVQRRVVTIVQGRSHPRRLLSKGLSLIWAWKDFWYSLFVSIKYLRRSYQTVMN